MYLENILFGTQKTVMRPVKKAFPVQSFLPFVNTDSLLNNELSITVSIVNKFKPTRGTPLYVRTQFDQKIVSTLTKITWVGI